MRPGMARVGQRVRLIKALHNHPDLTGTSGVVREILAQNPGALDDALLYRPDGVEFTVPLLASDIELLRR